MKFVLANIDTCEPLMTSDNIIEVVNKMTSLVKFSRIHIIDCLAEDGLFANGVYIIIDFDLIGV